MPLFLFCNRFSRLSIMMLPDVKIRVAATADIPALRELIQLSVRRLQAHDYSPEQMEAALRSVFGVDSQLIADGTYLVAEAALSRDSSALMKSQTGSVLAGCGGWSKRKTLYGGDRWRDREDDLLDPRRDAAKIRAFFIHPDWARRGIGTRILDACEAAAMAAGFSRFEMGATLTGAKLFRERGYVPLQKIDLALENGITLPIIHMEKQAHR
ncbi:MAG TPA: GNAT family N-acetyltransferase [Candidatus Angelobacter sp.]|nr:GNAT family N-acetyltransferase [Candidatus Angelobacter sp.]